MCGYPNYGYGNGFDSGFSWIWIVLIIIFFVLFFNNGNYNNNFGGNSCNHH